MTDDLYVSSYLYSVKVAAVSSLWCLAIGYPMAYAMARSTPTWRNVFLLLVMLPSLTSFLLRVYAWIGLLKNNGVINNVLMAFGVIDEPITMMQTDFAVYIGIVYSYLPFMILPLYNNLEKHDQTLLEAAADLGARPMTAFLRVTLPLSMDGIVAGSLLVFIPAVGEFVIPSLLGRTDQLMIGRVLSDEFFANRDWPVASSVAILMLVLLVVPIMVFQRYQNRELEARASEARGSLWSPLALILGFAFLYVPIISMIVFSFNNSRLVTVWDAAEFTDAQVVRRAVPQRADPQCRLAVDQDRRHDGDRGGHSRHGGGAGAGAVRALQGPHAAVGHDDGAAGHARGHHGPVHAAAVRVDGAADRLAAGPRRAHHRDRAHHLHDVLRDGHRAVAARRFRRFPGGSGDGPRARARPRCSSGSRCR